MQPCMRAVYTVMYTGSVHGPCIRPCTVRVHVPSVSTVVYTARLQAVYTAVCTARKRAVWLCTRAVYYTTVYTACTQPVYGRVHGIWHGPYTAVYTCTVYRVHGRTRVCTAVYTVYVYTAVYGQRLVGV